MPLLVVAAGRGTILAERIFARESMPAAPGWARTQFPSTAWFSILL
jgi:hypothetical protein